MLRYHHTKYINCCSILHNCKVSVLEITAKGERSGQDTEHLDFKVMVEPKDSQAYTVILVASSRQEKSAWTSDISQVCVCVL